jgi:hypothetical protein
VQFSSQTSLFVKESNVEYNPGSEHGVHGGLHAKRTFRLELCQLSERQTDGTKRNHNMPLVGPGEIVTAKTRRFASDMPVKSQVNLSAGDIFRINGVQSMYM